MRFKIDFEITNNNRILPIDYQYYICSWIYKVIESKDTEFAKFLHNEGYKDDNKRFKLFNYSNFSLGKCTFDKQNSTLKINNPNISMQISFHISEIAERFIMGLFNNQSAYIGDKKNGLELYVKNIERVRFPILKSKLLYQAKSPIVISYKYDNERYAKYLSPQSQDFNIMFINNIIAKSLISKNEYDTIPNIKFELLSQAKSKLITIKKGTKQESKIRGYIFKFSLEAPDYIHSLILNTGAGEKNSSGFGWCDIVNDNIPKLEKRKNIKLV